LALVGWFNTRRYENMLSVLPIIYSLVSHPYILIIFFI
jgi:hypothetical protein